MPSVDYDAVVVGSGPNGLAAAITLARAGCSVLVLEARETVGGGLRSQPLTLPGFVHDVCAAIHPLAKASPFFRSLPLADHGVTWVEPDAALAHPLDDGQAPLLERSVPRTGAALGADGSAYLLLLDVGAQPPGVGLAGLYSDKLVKTPAGWRFKSRHVEIEGPAETP